MLVHKLDRRLSLFDIAKIALISAVPTVVGISVLYASAGAMLDNQTRNAVEKLGSNYDAILSTAYLATKKVAEAQSIPCERVVDTLRKESARQIYIRSLSLLKNDKVYCSSVLTNIDEFNNEYPNFKPGATLLAGNVITPNTPVVYYRYENVLAVIDGRYMIAPLRNFTDGLELALLVDGRYLYASGHVYDKVVTPFKISKTSTRWDITVLGGYPVNAKWNLITGSYLPVILLFLLTSLIICFILSKRILSGKITPRLIRDAVKKGEITPYAQPIFDHTGEHLWGIEILARWKVAKDKVIPPDIFIYIAEESSLIMEITQSLMEQTALALRTVHDSLPQNFHVSFNISRKCCEGKKLKLACYEFNKTLDRKVNLTMELTERERFDNSDMLKECIKSLKGQGVEIAIDDFGTAGSNLDYIREFSFDFIKIDKSYVTGMEYEMASAHIIDNIIDLATRLGIEIIAEGIEKTSQADYLHGKGVHYFQGYLYSKPLPIHTILNKYFKPLI